MKYWLKNRFFTGMLVAILTGTVCCVAFQLNLFYGMQLHSTDFLFRSVSNQESTPQENEVTIIAIDDKSLDQLGHFSSWPRNYYADIIDKLVDNKARVIGFDILFSEKTTSDDELATSISNANNVIMPVVKNSSYSSAITTNSNTFLHPIADFEKNAVALGHANFNPDIDGVVRKLPLLLPDGDSYQPALSLSIVAKYLRRSSAIESDIQNGALSFAGRSIPVDNNKALIINYTNYSGGNGYVPFDTLSFIDVLQNKIDPELVTDKIVIIGATATGLGDTFFTPMGMMLNGVEIHAHVINSILTANFLQSASRLSTIILIMFLALLTGFVVLRWRLLYSSLSILLLFAGYFLLLSIYFDKGTLLNNFYPPIAILGTFVSINLYNVVTEQSQKKLITRTFGHYVSAPIVTKIVDALEKGGLKLGGTEQDVTVAFADIRGFTGIADKMPPDELVRVLNMYLSIVIQAVIDNQGVINKFGGDSVLAIWNAPTECTTHSLMAIKASIEAQNRIKEMQAGNPELPRMDFGIGINTGPAVVGNMGSRDRFEYSVIGDTVNIASKITDATKGGKIWIGETTFQQAKNYITVKILDELSIKGKEKRIKTFEVIELATTFDKPSDILFSQSSSHTMSLDIGK
jgi:adenylate cyclase